MFSIQALLQHTQITHAPCVRCNACEPACPERLNPELLHYLLQGNALQAAIDEKLLDCTTCAKCEAVCPSRIPLAQQFATAKSVHQQQAQQMQQTQEARERYDARTQRLQRIKIQRAEQHALRSKQTANSDAVAAALARAKARKQSQQDSI
jgi:Na+-translocating ferredoxin:NAD+ oxidoreductase subunit C